MKPCLLEANFVHCGGSEGLGSTKATRKQFPESLWESTEVSHKRVFALLTPEIRSYRMAQMLQKPVFALLGCQRMSVNTLLCDALGLAELSASLAVESSIAVEDAVENRSLYRVFVSRVF